MKRWTSSFALLLIAGLGVAAGDADLRRSLERCTAIGDDTDRLACFDEAAGAGSEASATEGWRVDSEDGSEATRLMVDGFGELKGKDVRARARLVIECSGGKLDALIVTGMAAHPERGRDDHTVLLRFDDDELFSVPMPPSPDGEALVIPWPVMTLNRLMEHERLYFQFLPRESRPASTTFPLAGLRELLEARLEPCGLIRDEDGSVDRRYGGS